MTIAALITPIVVMAAVALGNTAITKMTQNWFGAISRF